MSPDYRFYTADLLTGNVLGDIQLQAVNASMQLSNAGELTGSFPLGQPEDAYRLSITPPGRTAIYVERNTELIWGGIIWNRDRTKTGRAIDLVCSTFDSFFEHTVLELNYVKQAVEQVTCFTSLVSKVNAQAGSNIGLTCPSITATGIKRTILLPAYEFHFAQEVIDQLMDADDGLEYTVEVANTGTPEHPSKTIKLATTGALNVGQNIYVDSPGNVIDYTWPENATQGGNKFAGRGGGNGNKAPTAVVVDQGSLDAGYPSLWSVSNYPDVVDAKLVKAKTKRKVVTDSVPVCTPPIAVRGDVMAGNWQKLGATINFSINDVCFPSGIASTRRMYGWSMTFQDENNPERIDLITDNGATA